MALSKRQGLDSLCRAVIWQNCHTWLWRAISYSVASACLLGADVWEYVDKNTLFQTDSTEWFSTTASKWDCPFTILYPDVLCDVQASSEFIETILYPVFSVVRVSFLFTKALPVMNTEGWLCLLLRVLHNQSYRGFAIILRFCSCLLEFL